MSEQTVQNIYLIGEPEKTFNSDNMPSKRQVMRLFFYKIRNENNSVKDSLHLVAKDLIKFWRTNFPDVKFKRIDKIKELVKAIYEKWNSLNRNKKNNADHTVKIFEAELDANFDITCKVKENQTTSEIEIAESEMEIDEGKY